MTLHLGDVPAGSTLYIPFTTYDKTNGASVTMTGLAVTDIEIYKNGGTTQRASDAGYTLLDTDGIDFDGITGLHGFSIDLNDNTDAGFFAVGSFYWVVVSTITIDSQAVTFVPATFRIRAAEATAGYPKVDTQYVGGSASTAQTGDGYALLNGMVETDGPLKRYTANALEQGPVGAGVVIQDIIDGVFDEAKGAHAGFLTTLALEASITTLLNRLGAWTGTGVNTVLGAFKALLSKAASNPSDIGGTFDAVADSAEAISEAVAGLGAGSTDWTSDEREQIRDALGVTGDKTAAVGGQLQDKAEPGDEMLLTAAYDLAKTAAQAGDEMDLVDAPNATAVGAIQLGLATPADIEALLVLEIDGTLTFGQALAVMVARLAGPTSGGGTAEILFKDPTGTYTRITMPITSEFDDRGNPTFSFTGV